MMSLDKNGGSFTLLENLIADKVGIGAEYSFKKNTLEIRPNQQGVNGVFTRCALSKGEHVISTSILNGSLSPLRAYEEAEDLLIKLGPARFNLEDNIIIAAALYLRYVNTETRDSDLSIAEPNLKAAYARLAMSVHGSPEVAEMFQYNNRVTFDSAKKLDATIEKMDVDDESFRLVLAYTISRVWTRFGIIPIFDLFNASYSDSANCRFSNDEETISYILIRDVEAGEELTWKYNSANAPITWLTYGYKDDNRPTEASLEVTLTEEEKNRLDKFALEKCGWKQEEINSINKINPYIFTPTLKVPGKLSNISHLRDAVSNSLQSFTHVRSWFLMFILSDEEDDFGMITNVQLRDAMGSFGVGIEKKVLSTMQSALKNGLSQMHKRLEKFQSTDRGSKVDTTEYIEMAEGANAEWRKALAIAESICSAKDDDALLNIINTTLHLSLDSRDEISPALHNINLKHPTLAASIISMYTA